MDKKLELKCLEALGKNNHEAFNALFIAYHSLVKRFLLGFIKEEDEVLDIAQDIFVKIWIHRESVAKVDSFKAYLFKMVRNEIYNYFKLQTIHNGHLEKYSKQKVWIDNPEEKIDAEELALLLDVVVDNMPPKRKLIFKMSREEGLSNDEIAKRLDINKRTVENHITLALADLRKVLEVLILFII